MRTARLGAQRLSYVLVILLGLATLAPTASVVAATDLQTGTTAVVSGTGDAGATLREAPTYDATVIMTVYEGTAVTLIEGPVWDATGSAWYGITLWGETGYFPAIFLTGSDTTVEDPLTPPNLAPADEPVFTAAQTVDGATATIAYTNGDGVRCRTAPDYAGEILAVIPEGATISLDGPATGAWQPTTCAGTAGFVHSDFVLYGGGTTPVEPATEPKVVPAADLETDVAAGGDITAAAVGYGTVVGTNGDGVRCRSGASYGASTITVLAEGSSVALRGAVQGEWQPVTCAGMAGFAFAGFLGTGGGAPPAATPAPTTPGSGSGAVSGYATAVGTGGQGVRCRSGADYGASTITVLAEGTSVALRGAVQGEWQPVVCAGMNGFAFAGFLGNAGSAPPPATAVPTQPPASQPGLAVGTNARVTSALNLRYQASYSAGVAAVAEAGTVVRITGSPQAGFYPVDWDGLRGFMYGEYLVATNEALSERGGSASPAPAPTQPPANGGGSSTGSAIANYALRYQGYPYVWAGEGPAAFDCSGFTMWVIRNTVGTNITHDMFVQYDMGAPVAYSDLQPGDLVFFQNTFRWGMSHNGVYIGNNQFIHAENETTGVKISDITSDYYASRYYGAVRFT